MPLAALPKCFLDALCVSRQMSVDQWIDRSVQLGLDGLEFYWHFTPWKDLRELKRLRKRVEHLGMSIAMLCYSSDFTNPDPSRRREETEQQKIAIQTAARLGATSCRVLTGQRRPGVSRQQGLTWVRESLRERQGRALSRFTAAERRALAAQLHRLADVITDTSSTPAPD